MTSRFTTLLFSVLLSTPFAASAQLTDGRWVPEPSSTARYCADDLCSIQDFDASLSLFEFPEDGILETEFEISLAPLGIGFQFPVIIGHLLPLDAVPFTVDVTGVDEHPAKEFAFRFESSDSLFVSGFTSVEIDGWPLAVVSFENVEFRPVPEPTASAPLAVGLATLMAFARSPHRPLTAIRRTVGNRESGQGG
jgi:hypothetical protein